MKKFFVSLIMIISVIMSGTVCLAVPWIQDLSNEDMSVRVASNYLGWIRWYLYLLAIIIFFYNMYRGISFYRKNIVTIKNPGENNEEIRKKMKDFFFKGMIVIPLLLFFLGGLTDAFVTIDKPIIYLYPEETREISVKLGLEDKIIVSYPKYEDSWNVKAKPNGDLVDLETGRKLYALYYESEVVAKYKIEDEGFIIKGEDVAKFLEEKLELLGLNYKEAEEFIVYWLPKLEANKYNYIRFASAEEIERNMPLEVSGNPDSVIRVMMTYKGLNRPIEVKEQELITPERNGFVVVEWGGT